MLNSRVSDSSSSPPALACFTTKRATGRVAPRSTCRNKRPVFGAPTVGLPSRNATVHRLLRPLIWTAGQTSSGGTAEREILAAIGPVDLELVDPGDRLPAVGGTGDVQADEAGRNRRLDHVRGRPRIPGVVASRACSGPTSVPRAGFPSRFLTSSTASPSRTLSMRAGFASPCRASRSPRNFVSTPCPKKISEGSSARP